MRRSLLVVTAVCAWAFSGLSAAYVPWQHGTYRGEPLGPDARLAYTGGYMEAGPGVPAAPAYKAKNQIERGPAGAAPVCYRFKLDEELKFIRCY